MRRGKFGEIRLHHVFEHFSRATSLALLVGWRFWLKIDGILRIEVPDFQRNAWAVIIPCSSTKARYAGLRHLFGSQETNWAVHKKGWFTKTLCKELSCFDYKVKNVKCNHWLGTYNKAILARKISSDKTSLGLENIAKDWLTQYTVDIGGSEQRMLEFWITEYNAQIRKMKN